MIIPRISYGNPDKVSAIFRNFQSAAILDGIVLRWAISSDTLAGFTRIPGLDAVTGGAISPTVAGVASVSGNAAALGVASGQYGLCQVWGVHPNVSTTVAALAVDVVVTSAAAGAAVARSVAALGNISDQELGVCVTTGAANRAGIFIKCM